VTFQRVRCDTSTCIEVNVTPEAAVLRSSIRPDNTIVVTRDEWEALKVAIKEGQFDQ
jgi:hypothetical protein